MAAIKKDIKTNKWYVRVSFKDQNGKFKQKTKKGFNTKLEATRYASELQLKASNGTINDIADTTIFANFFEQWCRTYTIGKHSVSTDMKYEHEIKLVKSFFKNTKLSELTRQQYQDYINFRGKKRSKNTVEKTHGYLKKCLSYALADGLIKKDPSFGAVLYYEKEEADRIPYLDLNEVEKLLAHFESNYSLKDTMLYIALTTGLRIGEIYGLSYSDISPTSLSVNRGYDYRQTMSFTPGKTKSSIRTIAIPKSLYNVILKHQLQNKKINNDYLFLDNDLKPRISHNGLTKHLHKIQKQLNIKKINIHGLRHSHASVLLHNNVNIGFISKRLGHSNISETLNTYTHIIKELEQLGNEQVIEIFECKKSAK